MSSSVLFRLLAATIMALAANVATAENGHDLWLRNAPLDSGPRNATAMFATGLVIGSTSPTLDVAVHEVVHAIANMTGKQIPYRNIVKMDGAIVIGTTRSLPMIAKLNLPLASVGKDGYVIRSVRINGYNTTVIAGNTDIGVLYGTYAWIRRVAMRSSLNSLKIVEAPSLQLRILNHWDNIDGTIERGYAGNSIWDWWTLPDVKRQKYVDYARANASIGINGTVLNNVNADAAMLSTEYLNKVAALANTFRPYGIKVYLSVRFSSPMELGGLSTADPLDLAVAKWWQFKAAQIYRKIPDFGGFLVKANSEGQPGPQDYHRTHADGANMLAAALKPHGGIVMWRAFVYARRSKDRVGQAYDEFLSLDGKFSSNVILQVKNGPLDFQPREPFHPLFGAMQNTPLMMEFQITKEYLGFSTHVAYLGTLWQEVLRSDTGLGNKTYTVADRLSRPTSKGITGIAGVANIGTAQDWTGGVFNQANWYAFGRFSWCPNANARNIAREWAALTFNADTRFVDPVVDRIMMPSREFVVDYTGPLGLTHQMNTGHHYGPGPWIGDPAASIASSRYYSKADSGGIGFDRTSNGSKTIEQYRPRARHMYGDKSALDSRYLLWFHHVPWSLKLAGGRTVWDELVFRYDRGVSGVTRMKQVWSGLQPFVDADRFHEVTSYFTVQKREAQWWRDASVAFFQSQSHLPLPAGHAPPTHDIEWYKSIKVSHVPGTE